MFRISSIWPRVGSVVVYTVVFIAWSLATPGCNCGSTRSGTISCDTDEQCPPPLVCDETVHACTEGGDAGPYGCIPPLPGCPCVPNRPMIQCTLPGQDPAVIGGCREGQTRCESGIYGECVEQPNPECESVGVGAGGFDPSSDNSDQVVLGPEGELVLDPEHEERSFGFLWVANTGENTVSKIDIETGKEVARYSSVTDAAGLGLITVPPGGFPGDEDDCGNCPSRTAIDYNGDAFVANRAFMVQASVTKYANAVEDCIDKDGNGVIDTSVDLNGDGIIDKTNPGEFLGEPDECILWTSPVGNPGGAARALAIDAGGPDAENGNVWVGLYFEERAIALNGETGMPLLDSTGNPVSIPLNVGGTVHPYGAAADGGGNVWFTGREDNDTYLAKVNAYTFLLEAVYPIPEDNEACSDSYGISIDTMGRVWLGGWRCKDIKVFVPSTMQWYRRDIDVKSNTRGIAVDLTGHVWVAHSNGEVSRFLQEEIITLGDNAMPTTYVVPPLPAPFSSIVNNTIGVGIDRNGACWVVSRNDGSETGAASRILPDDTIESFPVGKAPYTYSDFTGFGLFEVVRPSGFWRGIIEGCAIDDQSDWKTLEWSEYEPPGTSVRVRLRAGDTVAALVMSPWVGPFDTSPVDLDAVGLTTSKYMQLEVQLSTTDPAVTPSFIGFMVTFDCPSVDPID
jgi:hypothetical protein